MLKTTGDKQKKHTLMLEFLILTFKWKRGKLRKRGQSTEVKQSRNHLKEHVKNNKRHKKEHIVNLLKTTNDITKERHTLRNYNANWDDSYENDDMYKELEKENI